jgi:hypothetical protein
MDDDLLLSSGFIFRLAYVIPCEVPVADHFKLVRRPIKCGLANESGNVQLGLHRMDSVSCRTCFTGCPVLSMGSIFHSDASISYSSSKGVRMYRDLGNLHALRRSRLLVHGNLLQLIQHILPLQNLPKYRILPIEMRRGREGDEELAAITVHALVRHADDAAGVVSQRWPDLILKQLVRRVVDGGGSLGLWVGCGGAGLDDEVWDEAVEGAGVVESGGAEGEEVLGGFRDGLTEDFEFDGPVGGVKLRG